MSNQHSSIYERLRALPQCVEVGVAPLAGHSTHGLLNTLNGLTLVQTTHTEGLLGRGRTYYQFRLARPAVTGETDVTTVLDERAADVLADVWCAQARALGLVASAAA